MADNKKYYYLRLKENFYDREEIKIIESMPNGHLYTNILLKLYLRSLKRNGRLMVTDYIPYSAETLAAVTNHNSDTVRAALSLFQQFKLIEILDNGAIYLSEIQNFIGESSSEADRKREYRNQIENERKNLLEVGHISDKCPKNKKSKREIKGCDKSSGQMSDKYPPETELETETELEQQQEIERYLSCSLNEVKVIFRICKKYHKNRNAVVVVKEKFEIIKVGKFKNKLGALVSAIKDDWNAPQKNNNTSNFNNFEPGSYDYDDIERKLLGWDDDEKN